MQSPDLNSNPMGPFCIVVKKKILKIVEIVVIIEGKVKCTIE